MPKFTKMNNAETTLQLHWLLAEKIFTSDTLKAVSAVPPFLSSSSLSFPSLFLTLPFLSSPSYIYLPSSCVPWARFSFSVLHIPFLSSLFFISHFLSFSHPLSFPFSLSFSFTSSLTISFSLLTATYHLHLSLSLSLPLIPLFPLVPSAVEHHH